MQEVLSHSHTLSGIYCLWISGWWPLWWCLLALCEFSLFLGEMSIFDWVVCFCDAELEEQHSFQVILDISVSVLTTYTEVIFWFLTCPERLPVSHRRLALEGEGHPPGDTSGLMTSAGGSGKGCNFWRLCFCFLLSSPTPPSGPASTQKLRLSPFYHREEAEIISWFWFYCLSILLKSSQGLCSQDSDSSNTWWRLHRWPGTLSFET